MDECKQQREGLIQVSALAPFWGMKRTTQRGVVIVIGRKLGEYCTEKEIKCSKEEEIINCVKSRKQVN